MTPPPIPDFLAHLPVSRGMPVPDVTAWSSEGLVTVRHDPIAGRVAVFSKGRQGRGRALFGIMHPERQRRAVLAGLCQICGWSLDIDDPGTGWLPNHPALMDRTDDQGGQWTMEPPCHRSCAEWSAGACPSIAGKVSDLIEVLEIQPVAQLLNLSTFVDLMRVPAARRSVRFDDAETLESIARLDRIARRHPDGVMGYARYQIRESEPHDWAP
jgi:hypothetical protein